METTQASAVDSLAALLIEAHGSRRPLVDLPASATITAVSDAYAVQTKVAATLGPHMGWKIGRRTDRPTNRAPLFTTKIFASGTVVPDAAFFTWIVESELMFRIGRDLPPRADTYSRAEVIAATSGVCPVFEIVDSRFAAYPDISPTLQLADGLSHGAMVVGREVPLSATVDYLDQPIIFKINGAVQIDQRGGNPAGDIFDLVVWAANQPEGLTAGECVTTGSYTGMPILPPGAIAEAVFDGIGSVNLTRGR
jgi:2-keto-4-pentenoate hydratase